MDPHRTPLGNTARLLAGLWLLAGASPCSANPHSRAYIPYRTDPYDQPAAKNKASDFWGKKSSDRKGVIVHRRPVPRIFEADKATDEDQTCPLRFSLGVSRKSSDRAPGLGDNGETTPLGIHQPPVVYPVLPWQGPGRQVLYATQYEHLDLLTPARGGAGAGGGSGSGFLKEGLTEHLEFPLLFESSAFQTHPLVADVNGDGILDAVLTDYHGGLYAIGLQVADGGSASGGHPSRYFLKAQVPRLYVRRQWMEAMVNETLGIDPYQAEKEAEEAAKKAEEERKAARAAEVAAGGEPPPEEEEPDSSHRAGDERPYDPYHSYFEYSYGVGGPGHEAVLQGVTANVLGQDQDHVKGLEERRKRKHHPGKPGAAPDAKGDAELDDKNQHLIHRDFGDESGGGGESGKEKDKAGHRRLLEEDPAGGDEPAGGGDPPADDETDWAAFADDLQHPDDDDDDDNAGGALGEAAADEADASGDGLPDEEEAAGVHVEGAAGGTFVGGGDDDYPPPHDDYARFQNYDDYYSGRYNDLHEDYFDDRHYIRLPPHVLCTPVLADLPKLYSNKPGETERLLFLAVSYYFDEDEYEGFFSYKRFEHSDHGDETETQRGMYTASAIMVFHFGDSPRWGRQEHLDLSADHSAPVNLTAVGAIPMREDNTKLGAFALSSPTVADIDGDGKAEVLMGTSMGFLYVVDARNLFPRDNFPVQLQYGIESRVLVEDVRGDTNLEIFVADVGGNVLCLDHTGKKLWHRDLLFSITNNKEKEHRGRSEVIGSSEMVLGDVNGDGILDLVFLQQIKSEGHGTTQYLYVLSADTGKDLEGYPINLWTKAANYHRDNVGEDFAHAKLSPPLLVDLHEDQSHIADYLNRNGTRFARPKPSKEQSGKDRGGEDKVPHGGTAGGLHIVQPIDTFLVIVEGGSGCTQSIEIGETINSMVQADDVHGTNKLDLVISTASGNVVTLESDAPFHPLNVWNHGELRSRTGGSSHGYSASQGIFVHEMSRRYRDIFGVYVPVTFQIFDNRPNIENEPDKRRYDVEVRTGTSSLVVLKTYDAPGIYTERFYIPSGPGHYQVSVLLKTTHGLVYEDAFHIGYNVNYMNGFSVLLWLPLTVATICVFLMGAKKHQSWEDDDYEGEGGKGILDGHAGLPD